MAVFCEECGASMAAEARFCGGCGAAVATEAPAVTLQAPVPQRPTPQTRPAAKTRPAPKKKVAPSVGLLALLVGVGLVQFVWRALIALCVVAAIAGYVWGGSNAAHLDCIAHRLGAPGIVGSFACAVEH
jgi:hypothetical protein